MTEETPKQVVDQYQFPDKYFSRLRELEDEDMGMYSVVTGGLYRALSDPDEPNFSEKDAMQITRMLQRGEIDEAEDQVYDQLEGES